MHEIFCTYKKHWLLSRLKLDGIYEYDIWTQDITLAVDQNTVFAFKNNYSLKKILLTTIIGRNTTNFSLLIISNKQLLHQTALECM